MKTLAYGPFFSSFVLAFHLFLTPTQAVESGNSSQNKKQMRQYKRVWDDRKELDFRKNVIVIVDKKVNKLHLASYNDGNLDIFQTFPTTLGQVLGDKYIEGDRKTPEGIYDFQFQALPPDLKPKFGVMALYVSYPNTFDKFSNKTGFDILIHGTNDPDRLKKKYDSLGCVVLDDGYVETIWKNIALKNSKVIITKDYQSLKETERLPRLKKFFQNWLNSWSNKDIDTYVDSYGYEFVNDGMKLVQFKAYKDRLNKQYDKIQVDANDVRFYLHEKYDVITFGQTYRSYFKNNVPAYNVRGKKTLYLQERNGQYKIIREELDRS